MIVTALIVVFGAETETETEFRSVSNLPVEEKQCQQVTESGIRRLWQHLVTTPCVQMPTLSMQLSTAADAAWLLIPPSPAVNTNNAHHH